MTMFQTRLFVGNLPCKFEENDLRSAFSKYGEVINLDIKSKSAAENEASKFAFVTINGQNNDVEACIKNFGNIDFNGSKLYVTRARESFLERLQRERQQNEQKEAEKHKHHKELPKKHPVMKLGDGLNPRKRKIDANINGIQSARNFKDKKKPIAHEPSTRNTPKQVGNEEDKKKLEANKKRMESLLKKRQEFRSKQQIIKTGLLDIDKKLNKKLRFSDTEEDVTLANHNKTEQVKNLKRQIMKNILFDDDESDGEVNFEIKKQYEGKKGQKVLDLQSRYKSDKRFVLDERFIEDDHTEDEADNIEGDGCPSEDVEVTQGDEKSKQIKILEDVLGVALKPHASKLDKDKKLKPTLGMIRFDPMNPDHAKFVVPMEELKTESKKSKKNKVKEVSEPDISQPETPKVEVSKEQFYKSEITKEAFEQPAAGFSLRSLFNRDNDTGSQDQEEQSTIDMPVQLQKQQKVKNPLDPGEKNPFVYDSSESEAEDDTTEKNTNTEKDLPEVIEMKAVWKESLFFCIDDIRLQDGLAFFNNISSHEVPKERRELKSVMKKRIHNTARKNQMFKKKIGGRKKSMKKSYKKKS